MNDFSFRERDGLTLLVCDPLEAVGFKHAFSTRRGGVSPLPAENLSLGNFSQDQRANVLENRRRFQAALEAADWSLVTARQIHSPDVRSVRDTADAASDPTECDALTANLPRTLLAVQTADCMPILLADPRTGAFAAVHAGWRGTQAGIVARTVKRMQQMYDSRPADLYAALGPAISAAVFEVGPEVLDAFRREFVYADELIADQQADGKGHLNLNRANLRQLLDCGLSEGRVYDSGLCTWLRNDLFFSYRRERGAEQPVGRLMGVIGRA
jgi:hypothetical protein